MHKVDEIVMLKEQVRQKYKAYKHATEEANSLMRKRELHYNSLTESMLQLSQSRVSIQKSYLQKYVGIMESFFKGGLAHLASMAAAVHSINDKDNHFVPKEAISSSQMFSLMKCTEYISEYGLRKA